MGIPFLRYPPRQELRLIILNTPTAKTAKPFLIFPSQSLILYNFLLIIIDVFVLNVFIHR